VASEPWFNQTLTTVNDAVVRLGILEGEFHWHKHDDQDEFFLVLDGELLIDLEERETVTSGTTRGTRCPEAWCIARERHSGPRC
jgi:mannose-6-phosphate isomerase-like protein (cupin superfamily)